MTDSKAIDESLRFYQRNDAKMQHGLSALIQILTVQMEYLAELRQLPLFQDVDEYKERLRSVIETYLMKLQENNLRLIYHEPGKKVLQDDYCIPVAQTETSEIAKKGTVIICKKMGCISSLYEIDSVPEEIVQYASDQQFRPLIIKPVDPPKFEFPTNLLNGTIEEKTIERDKLRERSPLKRNLFSKIPIAIDNILIMQTSIQNSLYEDDDCQTIKEKTDRAINQYIDSMLSEHIEIEPFYPGTICSISNKMDIEYKISTVGQNNEIIICERYGCDFGDVIESIKPKLIVNRRVKATCIQKTGPGLKIEKKESSVRSSVCVEPDSTAYYENIKFENYQNYRSIMVIEHIDGVSSITCSLDYHAKLFSIDMELVEKPSEEFSDTFKTNLNYIYSECFSFSLHPVDTLRKEYRVTNVESTINNRIIRIKVHLSIEPVVYECRWLEVTNIWKKVVATKKLTLDEWSVEKNQFQWRNEFYGEKRTEKITDSRGVVLREVTKIPIYRLNPGGIAYFADYSSKTIDVSCNYCYRLLEI